MRNMIGFYHLSRHACESTANSDRKLTLAIIKEQMGDIMYEISSMKFQVRVIIFLIRPTLLKNSFEKSEEEIMALYDDLQSRMQEAFRALQDA